MITLSGEGEIELTGGRTIVARAGDVLLMEDVTGKGHISRGRGTADRVTLFILLAEWSNGASWGLSASLVRGVRGWADRDWSARDAGASAGKPPAPEPLPPMRDPYASIRRSPQLAVPAAELIELEVRSLPR